MNMEYRRLGKTDLRVSVVGIGSLGFFRHGEKEIAPILNRALDLGVNIIDTAHGYADGVAEKGIGQVVKERRKECIILSRAAVWQNSDDPAETTRSLEESLRRLHTDVIDIYQLHDITVRGAYQKVMENGIYEALKKAKKEGKVRYIGFSTHATVADMTKIVISGDVDVLTIAYNITHHKRQLEDGDDISLTSREIFPLAKKYGVGLTVMKPFGGGILTRSSIDGRKLSPVKILRYTIQNPYVTTVTPGVDNLEQLEEVVKAGDKNSRLSREEMKELEEEAKKWGRDFCRQCGYCLPCTEGISIPEVMRLLMDWRLGNEKVKEKARENYIGLEKRADVCIECRECEERCPYQIKISEWMGEAKKSLGTK